jgi:antitoxin ParD1/3/4
MAIRKSITISITPEQDRFVAAQITSGRYQTASEVFRAGLRLLEREEGATLSPDQPTVGPPRRSRARAERP